MIVYVAFLYTTAVALAVVLLLGAMECLHCV